MRTVWARVSPGPYARAGAMNVDLLGAVLPRGGAAPGAARFARALVLIACAALGPEVARAANPQPYRVDWVSSGDSSIDPLLKATSQLQQLRKSAPVDPYGLIARARGDVPRLQTVLDSFGYYQGSIAITINGQSLESGTLGETLAALPKGTEARIRITPRLGPLYHVGRIDVQGMQLQGTEGTQPEAAKLKLQLSPGAPAAAADVLAAGANLQSALQNAGYAFASVDKPVAYERPETRTLDVTYHVTRGPRVRVGEIRLEGLKEVSESLVRRRLLLRTGALYDASAVEKARLDLVSLGVFSSVSVRLGKAADTEGRVPVTFVFRESKRYTVGVSAAYSSDLGGSGGINWSNRNLLGGAQELSFSATAINLGGTASTGLGYDATLGYSIPEFYQRDQTLHLTVSAIRQALLAYTQTEESAGATLSRKLSTLWTATAGITYQHEIIGQQCVDDLQGLNLVDGVPISCSYNYSLVLLPLGVLYDSTDLPSPLADPTHGYRVSFNVTPTFSYGSTGATVGGGVATYIVSQASLTTYFDMRKIFAADPPARTVLAARVMAGVTQGAVWYDLPPDQRFYAGGSGTVRGYRYQTVGPQFATAGVPNGLPTGGTTLQVVNLELRQRVGTNFGFVVFADGGGVSQSASPLSGIFRIGVGTGVRYYTAIGPIRFDIAVPTNRGPGDDKFEVYIGIGQAF